MKFPNAVHCIAGTKSYIDDVEYDPATHMVYGICDAGIYGILCPPGTTFVLDAFPDVDVKPKAKREAA